MTLADLKAPFPWFGGKRRVASLVWESLGDVDNYCEPFAGSLAVLLGRPSWHKCRAETVNDADALLANFWRAVTDDPEAVASWADWPVNEIDLFARHLWLVNEGTDRIVRMESDPGFYDAKVAGWWVWGINAWIGSGWCSGTGPWKRADVEDEARQLPHLGDAGRGLNASRGVNRKRPHLGNAGQGVNRHLPEGREPVCADASVPTSATLISYLTDLAFRLRKVRVCCGDWPRVVTDGALNYGATVGIFLDPPYLGDVRTSDLYSVDDHSISTAVREWAIANGDNPRYRIVLAGYAEEHERYIPQTWRTLTYSASRAYGTSASATDSGNGGNRHNERLWFSPHCLNRMQEVLAL